MKEKAEEVRLKLRRAKSSAISPKMTREFSSESLSRIPSLSDKDFPP